MKKLANFSVNYPVTVSIMVVAILLLGYISLSKLDIDLFPDMNAPRIFVEIKAGERPPEEIEKQFVENIESQAIRQKGVSQVSSISMVGSARITVEYNWATDMDEAFLDLQKALTSYSQNTDIEEFTITQHDPNASPVMIIAMLHPKITDMDELRKTGENYIRNELIRLEGVADVRLIGTEEKEIIIETDQYKLKAHGLTSDQIVQQIQNMNRNISGGSIVDMGKKYIIKGAGLLENIGELENLVISFKQEQNTQNNGNNILNINDKVPVYLKDIAKISLINKKPRNIVHINGKRCVGMSIYKETGFNTVKAVEYLKEAMNKIEKALPGYEFVVVQNQGKFIQNSINEVEDTAFIGALMAIIVLFVFLRRIGVTAIVSFAIPISVIATFNLMYFNGLSLNIMTLGGLALGAGMLVDNAIVVVENIFRNLESGLSVKEAAIKGTAEVGGAIVASTLTTIVVFLPIVYLHGASGVLFKDQAWTVAFSLLASLFVAILVIPMLFHFFYRSSTKELTIKSVNISWYADFLSKVLDKKGLVILFSTVLLLATAFIFPFVGNEFLPKSGVGEFSLDIKLREGTQLSRTASTVKNIESMIQEVLSDKLEIIYTQIGQDNSSSSEKSVFQNENTANIKIRLKPEAVKNSEYIINTISELLGQIPDVEISVSRDETALQSILGTDDAPLVVELKGNSIDVLASYSDSIKQKLQQIPDLLNINTSIEEGAPEIDVVIDRYKASLYNLSAENIIGQLQDLLMGKSAGKFEKNGEMNDITVKLPDIGLSEFYEIKLKSGNMEIPLYEVAKIKKSVSPKQMYRRNQNRISKISADMHRDVAFDKVVKQVREKLKTIELPQGYRFQLVGEEQKRQEAMSNLSFALMLSVILVYMVMASQFESLLHPFTILLTIPLAGVGAIWAFFLLGKSLNIMAFIGIIMLAGIAVNDSIILVDAINRFKAQGETLRDAIIKAGQNRIRPIIMTSLTTILALLPLTIGFGESASLRSPMAIAVIGGLLSSTVLTLIVIPSVYYVFENFKEKMMGK